ncbi:MAG: divalent-cation tolerance protein CutA, partial [Myxococcales bacterium]|nr:divalent-cation tolerance protein CutA [Myxococcales bacterium]
MSDALLVYCTFPDPESAQHAARDLVEQRLAACVNILDSVRSVYRWEDKVCQEQECLTITKTTASQRLAQRHGQTHVPRWLRLCAQSPQDCQSRLRAHRNENLWGSKWRLREPRFP